MVKGCNTKCIRHRWVFLLYWQILFRTWSNTVQTLFLLSSQIRVNIANCCRHVCLPMVLLATVPLYNIFAAAMLTRTFCPLRHHALPHPSPPYEQLLVLSLWQTTDVSIATSDCIICYHVNLNPFAADPLKALHLPYWFNPPYLIFDIQTPWGSGLSTRVPECQKLKIVG